MPLVTVLMSVYNGEKHLRETIDSILNQTFNDFEFIIINDGSTDRSRKIIESCNDKRIVLINQENKGLVKSLNYGISLAMGRYIARMDQSDVSFPGRLQREVDVLEADKEVGLVGVSYIAMDEKGKKIYEDHCPAENEVIQAKLINKNCFCHGAVMFRKRCLEEVGHYREIFSMAEDYDLWLRITEKYKARNIDELLYKWRIEISGATIARQSIQEVITKFAQEIARDRRSSGRDRLAGLFREELQKELNAFVSKIAPRPRDFDNIFRGNPQSSNIKMGVIADGYYHWTYFLFSIKNYGYAGQFLWRSLWYNPFVFKRWKLLLILLFGKKNIDKIKDWFGLRKYHYF